jgi:hypothetical protein
VTALLPASEHVSFIGINEAGSSSSLPLFREMLLGKPAMDGTWTQTNALSDLRGCQAPLLELNYLLIPLKTAFTTSALHLLDERCAIGLSRSNQHGRGSPLRGNILLVLLLGLCYRWRNEELGKTAQLGLVVLKDKR